MKIKDAIVQFVCYETNMNTEEFVMQWERFTKRFLNKGIEVTLQEQMFARNKFRFISRNVWPQDSFQFVFMEGRLSHNFPEGHVKVVEAGGYTPLQIECNHAKDATKIMVFAKNPKTDTESYKKMTGYQHLNIYEAYYESCKYAYILEFFVKEMNVTDFRKQLDLKNNLTEIGVYKEYSMMAV